MWEYLALGDQSNALASGGLLAEFTASNSPYALQEQGYVPILPPRRASEGLGGLGPYQTATESLLVLARGATPHEALFWADRLLQLIERAALTRNGNLPLGSVAPLRLYAQAQGSAQRYDALIVHVAAEPLLLMPTPQQIGGWAVPLTFTITRRAEWRVVEETQTTSAANQPTIQTVTFTGADQTESPAFVRWSWTTALNPFSSWPGLNTAMLWAQSGNIALQVAPGNASVSGFQLTGDWSAHTDGVPANQPGTILRFAPTAGNYEVEEINIDPCSLGGHPLAGIRTMRRPLFVVVCRPSANVFSLGIGGLPTGGTTSTTLVRTRLTPLRVVGSIYPQIVAVGIVPVVDLQNGIALIVQTTQVDGPVLDISQIAVIDMADPLARALYVTAPELPSTATLGIRAYETDLSTFGVDPFVGGDTADTGALTRPVVRYGGDAFFTVGTTQPNPTSAAMSGLLLATYRQYWRLTNISVNPIAVTLRASRRRAQRVPQ
jgi:hypothetical protein